MALIRTEEEARGEISRKLLAWLRSPSEDKRDPAPVSDKPERNIREEIMRRTAVDFGGQNHGEVGGPASKPGPDDLFDRYHRLRNS